MDSFQVPSWFKQSKTSKWFRSLLQKKMKNKSSHLTSWNSEYVNKSLFFPKEFSADWTNQPINCLNSNISFFGQKQWVLLSSWGCHKPVETAGSHCSRPRNGVQQFVVFNRLHKQDVTCQLVCSRGAGRIWLPLEAARIIVSPYFQSLCEAKLKISWLRLEMDQIWVWYSSFCIYTVYSE